MGDEEKCALACKVVLIGESGVGKTSIISRYIQNQFSAVLMSTTGASFATKTIYLEEQKQSIKFEIWDTAGQERYMSVNKNLFLKVQGILLFYSITDRESFEHITNWVDIIRDTCDSLPIILIGNKKDDENSRIVSEDEGKKLANNFNLEFLEASGKENINVKESFEKIAEAVIANTFAERKNNLQLSDDKKNGKNKKKCCK